MSKYSDLIQATAERMLDLMKQGTIPWRRPWNDPEAPQNGSINGPWNPTTGKAYRGSNTLILRGAQLVHGYEDSRWLTYKQTAGIGGAQVRRGEKGQQIAYWDFSKTGEAQEGEQPAVEGEGLSRPVRVRRYRVQRQPDRWHARAPATLCHARVDPQLARSRVAG